MTAVSDETGRDALATLAEQCREILEWHKTGNLADGEVRRLAVMMQEGIPEHTRLHIAENKIASDAMKYVCQAALSAAPVETITVPFNPCLAKLRDGEPFFVLIGRDKQAPNAVMTWARDREAAEGPSPWVEQAREVAATMAAYSGAAPVAQEPVAWQFLTRAGKWVDCEKPDPEDFNKMGVRFRGLYTAPPATSAGVVTANVGRWLSAALDDPQVCDEMKADILAWMEAGKPNVQPSAGVGADEIARAIKEAIECITDLGSGKGGWAWEEVVQRLALLSRGSGSDQAKPQQDGSR